MVIINMLSNLQVNLQIIETAKVADNY